MSLLTYIAYYVRFRFILVIEIWTCNHENIHTNYTKWQRVLSEKKVDEIIYYASIFWKGSIYLFGDLYKIIFQSLTKYLEETTKNNDFVFK